MFSGSGLRFAWVCFCMDFGIFYGGAWLGHVHDGCQVWFGLVLAIGLFCAFSEFFRFCLRRLVQVVSVCLLLLVDECW